MHYIRFDDSVHEQMREEEGTNRARESWARVGKIKGHQEDLQSTSSWIIFIEIVVVSPAGCKRSKMISKTAIFKYNFPPVLKAYCYIINVTS